MQNNGVLEVMGHYFTYLWGGSRYDLYRCSKASRVEGFLV